MDGKPSYYCRPPESNQCSLVSVLRSSRIPGPSSHPDSSATKSVNNQTVKVEWQKQFWATMGHDESPQTSFNLRSCGIKSLDDDSVTRLANKSQTTGASLWINFYSECPAFFFQFASEAWLGSEIIAHLFCHVPDLTENCQRCDVKVDGTVLFKGLRVT